MEFFKNFSFLWKGLQISLLTSPQPPADIKFKSSYAKKHIVKKVESRTQLLNPEWRSYQSFTQGVYGPNTQTVTNGYSTGWGPRPFSPKRAEI